MRSNRDKEMIAGRSRPSPGFNFYMRPLCRKTVQSDLWNAGRTGREPGQRAFCSEDNASVVSGSCSARNRFSVAAQLFAMESWLILSIQSKEVLCAVLRLETRSPGDESHLYLIIGGLAVATAVSVISSTRRGKKPLALRSTSVKAVFRSRRKTSSAIPGWRSR
jgi:hypothetical protein